MKNASSRNNSQPTRPKPWVGIHSGADHTPRPAPLLVIRTIRWDDWKVGRNMWLLLGEKNPKNGLSLEREQPSSFQCPCHCHPLMLFFSTFTMSHMGSCTIFFWHVCFLPIESKAPWRQGYLSVLLTDGFVSTWYRAGSLNGRHACMGWAL